MPNEDDFIDFDLDLRSNLELEQNQTLEPWNPGTLEPRLEVTQ